MSSTKKNKFVKFLFPVVLAIWAYVGYIIYDAFNSDAEATPQAMATATFKAPKIQKKESFELLSVESDPFLGTLYKKPKQPRTGGKRIKKDTLKWPVISYQGTVSGSTGKSAIYMVSINGQQYLLSKGEEASKITLIKGTIEQVTLRFEGKTRQFPIM